MYTVDNYNTMYLACIPRRAVYVNTFPMDARITRKLRTKTTIKHVSDYRKSTINIKRLLHALCTLSCAVGMQGVMHWYFHTTA